MTRYLLIIIVLAGFAVAHGIALFQINSAASRAGSQHALFLDTGD